MKHANTIAGGCVPGILHCRVRCVLTIALMMEAVSVSETSINIHQITRCNISQDSHLDVRYVFRLQLSSYNLLPSCYSIPWSCGWSKYFCLAGWVEYIRSHNIRTHSVSFLRMLYCNSLFAFKMTCWKFFSSVVRMVNMLHLILCYWKATILDFVILMFFVSSCSKKRRKHFYKH